MTTDTAPKLVKAVTCRRCTGTGYVASHVVVAGAPGTCLACLGDGVVEGDRATIAAAKGRAAARKTASLKVWSGDLGYGELTDRPLDERAAARNFRDAVTYGWSHLEANDTARHDRCVASVNADHPDVFVALAAYALSLGYVAPLGRDILAPNGTKIGA